MARRDVETRSGGWRSENEGTGMPDGVYGDSANGEGGLVRAGLEMPGLGRQAGTRAAQDKRPALA